MKNQTGIKISRPFRVRFHKNSMGYGNIGNYRKRDIKTAKTSRRIKKNCFNAWDLLVGDDLDKSQISGN